MPKLRKPAGFLLATILLLSSAPVYAQNDNQLLGDWGTVVDVPVFFNSGTLTANGFDVDEFRNTMIDAFSVWNEESHSAVNFFYAGDTALDEITGAVVVNHQDCWADPFDGRLAAAFEGAGDIELQKPKVRVFLRQPQVMGGPNECNSTVRNWCSGTGGGCIDYEAVMVHELGHMIGLADVVTQTGIMNGGLASPAYKMLFWPDMESALGPWTGNNSFGPSSKRVKYITSPNGSVWSSATTPLVSGSPLFTTHGPALAVVDPINPSSRSTALVRATPTGSDVYRGLPSWSLSTASALSTGPTGNWYGWAAAGNDEPTLRRVLAVRPMSCRRSTLCEMQVVYFDLDNSFSQTLRVQANMFGRPQVAYDASRDRFIIVTLQGGNQEIVTYSTPAEFLSLSDARQTGATRFRHTGGAVFNDAGAGLLTMVSDAPREPTWVKQMRLTFNSAVASYDVDLSSINDIDSGIRGSRRPFGMARNPTTGEIVLALRGGGAPQPITIQTKASVDPTVLFGPVTYPSGVPNVRSSLDVEFDTATQQFVIAYAQQ